MNREILYSLTTALFYSLIHRRRVDCAIIASITKQNSYSYMSSLPLPLDISSSAGLWANNANRIAIEI